MYKFNPHHGPPNHLKYDVNKLKLFSQGCSVLSMAKVCQVEKKMKQLESNNDKNEKQRTNDQKS